MGVHRHDNSLGPPLYIIRLVSGLILYIYFGSFSAVFGNDTLLWFFLREIIPFYS